MSSARSTDNDLVASAVFYCAIQASGSTTIRELARETRENEGEVEQIVAELVAVGLLQRHGAYVKPTEATLRFCELCDAAGCSPVVER